jgi:hypothetical protein
VRSWKSGFLGAMGLRWGCEDGAEMSCRGSSLPSTGTKLGGFFRALASRAFLRFSCLQGFFLSIHPLPSISPCYSIACYAAGYIAASSLCLFLHSTSKCKGCCSPVDICVRQQICSLTTITISAGLPVRLALSWCLRWFLRWVAAGMEKRW